MEMSMLVSGRLRQLARLYHVQTAYYDVGHHRRQASVEGLLAVLQALGASVTSLPDIASALRERRQALWQRIMEPVNVVWDGIYPTIKVRLPGYQADARLAGHLELEHGEKQPLEFSAADLTALDAREVEGTGYVVREIRLPKGIPYGYHRLTLEVNGNPTESLIISAPNKAYLPPEGAGSCSWGIFMPLYALQTRTNWGSGDYSAFRALADLVADTGGQVVATLPLLPTFLDEPLEPSPYAPVSRLLWNEFYIDIKKVPELAECLQAQALLQSSSLLSEIKDLRDLPLVDYRRQMALKRRVLEELCQYLMTEKPDRFTDFQGFIQANPVVEDYALFRSVMEKQRAPWRSWPQPLRNGTIKREDYEERTKQYYMYAQWLAHQQVQALSEKAGKKGLIYYFDLPLGVHPDGYDVWRERCLFALEASAGAPPDAVFTRGQNWLFPPLHPEKIREKGYRYIVSYLRHHLGHASMLRIDHVMGLHRLFWIPQGMDASQGVYVRYHADEFYAILTLESHRHRSVIVGEDLGTVPAYVRPAMSRHGLHRMYVIHYELAGDSSYTLRKPSRTVVASLNTHDMPPFAAFWKGLDIQERMGVGLLTEKGARVEKRSRKATRGTLLSFLKSHGWLRGRGNDIRAVLKACLSYLSASAARVVLVNLEDLWLETQSQNVPGTGDACPNWRRKARYTLEELCQMPEVRDILKEIDRLRKRERR